MCIVDGCVRLDIAAKGLCRLHYRRQYDGRPLGPAVSFRELPTPQCAAPGCTKPIDGNRLFCRKHYIRAKRHGDPSTTLTTERGTVRVESVIFNCITFRRYPDAKSVAHRRYFKPNGWHISHGVQALHQEVWKSVNDPIPPGHDIHHRDGDHANNAPENLECVLDEIHATMHSGDRSRRGRSAGQLSHLDTVRVAASAWHRSPEGRAWHREHAKRTGFGRKRSA